MVIQVPPAQRARIISALSRGRTQQPEDMRIANLLLAESPSLRRIAERGETAIPKDIAAISKISRPIGAGLVSVDGTRVAVKPEERAQFIEFQTRQGRTVQAGGRTFRPQQIITRPETRLQTEISRLTGRDLPQTFAEAQARAELETKLRQPTVIRPAERPSGLAGLGFDITGQRRQLEARARVREEGVKPLVTKTQLAALGLSSSVISQIQALLSPIETIKGTGRTLGETFKFITGQGETPFAQVGRTLRTSPEFATGFVAGEVLGLKGINLVFAKVPPKIAAELTKASPKFRAVEGGVIADISSTTQRNKFIRQGATIKELLGEDISLFKGDISGTTKIEVVGGISTFAEPLAEQVRLAGTKPTIAVSAQRDLFGVIRKRKIDISKPIPNEELLTTKTKSDLQLFRQGRLPQDRIENLGRRIVLETKGAGNLLETSFFADPKGRLRPSRLGLSNKEASLLDILSGDVTFKRSKPQALFFEDISIAKFPSALKGIELKLKKGIELSESDKAKLLRFQLTPTGEFKPIGFLTREPEIVLANGEVIRRVRTEAVTVINGRRVPIIRTEIIKDAKLSELFKKVSRRAGTEAEIRLLSKSTGIDFSSVLKEAKFISPTGLGISAISKISRVTRVRKRVIPPSISSKITRDSSGFRTSRPFSSPIKTSLSGTTPKRTLKKEGVLVSRLPGLVRPIIRGDKKRIITRTPPILRRGVPTIRRGVPTGRPPITRPPIVRPFLPSIIPRTPEKFLKKKLSPKFQQSPSFDIRVRRRGKFVTVNKRLPFNLALKQGAERIDRNLRATFRLKPNPKPPLKPEIARPKIPTSLFRRPKPTSKLFKKDTLTIIERANKRLSQKTETQAIALARAKKLKKIKFRKLKLRRR